MQATRQRILDTLEQRGSASPKELAQAFGMSPANLRRHLSILQTRGLVQSMGMRPAEGRGRPEQAYALTHTAQGDNLAGLSKALLEGLDTGDRPRNQDARLKHLARRLLGPASPMVGQITQRLVATVQRLTPLGYRPHWEARPQGPQMVLGHCPYTAIIADHPELCRMDAHLLEVLLGLPVEQVAKLQPGPQGTPQCVFVLQLGQSR